MRSTQLPPTPRLGLGAGARMIGMIAYHFMILRRHRHERHWLRHGLASKIGGTPVDHAKAAPYPPHADDLRASA